MQVTLQALTPFDESLLWRFHDAYWTNRGIDAWNQGEVPYYSTSNYASARQHAGFFTDLVLSQLEAGRLAEGQEIWVLEVGCGLGRFAANFLRAMEVACGPAANEIYQRMRYVISDYSERSLREACATPAVAPYVASGRAIPALMDLRDANSLRVLDGKTLPSAAPFQMLIANYTCCIVPLKHLQFRPNEGWLEQWVKLEASLPDASVDKPVPELIEEMLKDPAREGMVKAIDIQSEWKKAPLEAVYPRELHRKVLEATVRGLGDATVSYPHGFIEFVDGAARYLAPGGTMLVNDYGSVQKKDLAGVIDKKPQIYGNSIANAINFAVFDGYAEATGWHLQRSRDVLGSLHSAALRPNVPWSPREKASFDQNYIRWRGGDDILDFTHTARSFVEKKDYDRALRYWRRAIELEPENPDHHYRAGDTAIDGGQYDLAIAFLQEGRSLAGPECNLDFEFQLGRATCLAQDYPTSMSWYEKALEKENHPTTWTNLGVLYESAERYQDAYNCYKKAMDLDAKYTRSRERMQILKDLLWRRKVEEFDGAGAKDPLRVPEEEKAAKADDEEHPAKVAEVTQAEMAEEADESEDEDASEDSESSGDENEDEEGDESGEDEDEAA